MTQAPCATRSAPSSAPWRRRSGTCPPGSRRSCSRPSADRAPEGPDWLFEIKYDGVRVLAERRGDAVTLLGRSEQVVTARYPEIVAALGALAFEHFLLDGEIVALDARGVSSFQRLQARMGLTRPGDVARAMAAVPVEAVFFDCLALEGHDLRRVPLAARKECLQRVLPPLGVTRYGDHVQAAGPAFLEAATEARLEGILAKRAASAYVARTRGRVAQDQVPASPGVRDRRLHRPPGQLGPASAPFTSASTTAGGSSTCPRSARASTAPSWSGSGGGSSRFDRTRLHSTRALPRDAATTGSSPGSSARSASPTGRGTVASAIRPTSASGTTSAPRTCRRETLDADDWAGDLERSPDRDRDRRGCRSRHATRAPTPTPRCPGPHRLPGPHRASA